MIDFHRLIAEWYRLNARDLPWRNTKNPYLIWLSEIILQQTRVNQGLNYYLKFVNNYPTVTDLADASEQQILNDWQGLGYYSRARNLHATAKIIAYELDGCFPSSFEEIKKLKGIGDYTAAAIASFAFDLPHAVVDGNVYRVLSRCFDVEIPIDSSRGKKEYAALATSLLPVEYAALHNQAVMELGALQCVPSNPQCFACPLSVMCLSLAKGNSNLRPVKEKKTKIRNRYFHFLIFKNGEKVLLQKREAKDIWQHLFQFPMIETEQAMSMEEIGPLFKFEFGVKAIKYSEEIIHILSHQKITAVFYHFELLPQKGVESCFSVEMKDLLDYPLPRLIDRYLQESC